MSTLYIDQIQGPADNGNVISMSRGSVFSFPGRVIQTEIIRSDICSFYNSLTTGDGTPIYPLNITFTPKYSNSLLLIEWMICGEIQHDNVFVIQKNDSLITTAGYQGYNSQAGNQRWSGYVPANYDADDGSTPQNWYILYSEISGSTSTRTYTPAIRSGSGSQYTFTLNRTLNSGDAHEFMVSTGVIMEIEQ